MAIQFSDWLEALQICSVSGTSDEHTLCRNLHARLTAASYRNLIPDLVRATYERAVTGIFASNEHKLRGDPKGLKEVHDQAVNAGGRAVALKGGTSFPTHGRLAKIMPDTTLFKYLVDKIETQKLLGILPKRGVPEAPQILQALRMRGTKFSSIPKARLHGKFQACFATCHEILSQRLDSIDSERDKRKQKGMRTGVLDAIGIPLSMAPTTYVAVSHPAAGTSITSHFRPTMFDVPADYLFVSQSAHPPHDIRYDKWGCASVCGEERHNRLAQGLGTDGGALRGLPEVVHEPCPFNEEFELRLVAFFKKVTEPKTPDLTQDILEATT